MSHQAPLVAEVSLSKSEMRKKEGELAYLLQASSSSPFFNHNLLKDTLGDFAHTVLGSLIKKYKKDEVEEWKTPAVLVESMSLFP